MLITFIQYRIILSLQDKIKGFLPNLLYKADKFVNFLIPNMFRKDLYVFFYVRGSMKAPNLATKI